MNSPDLIFTQDETYEVQPGEIESVLQALWRDSLGEEAEASVVQVRTLNLLVFVPAAQATEDVRRAIEVVSVQHPGRTITMIAADDGQQAHAQVAIACRFGGNGKHICGEQITLTSGEGGAPFPSLAASLLVAGIPTFLAWLGDPPFDSPLYDSFIELADHVIVDSRTWQQPRATLPRLAQAIRAHADFLVYTDLQWTALTPWRRFTSQCFDLPSALPYLPRLEQVHITHGAQAHDQAAALLYLGWLASRLGWKFVQQAGRVITLQSNDETIMVTLQALEGARGLHEIMLGGGDARFQLRLVPETMCVKTEVLLPQHTPIERMARLSTHVLDTLLSEELNMLDRDPTYEAALEFAAQLTPA